MSSYWIFYAGCEKGDGANPIVQLFYFCLMMLQPLAYIIASEYFGEILKQMGTRRSQRDGSNIYLSLL